MTYSDYDQELYVECRQPIVGVHGELTLEVGDREFPLLCSVAGDIYAQVRVYENQMEWDCPLCGFHHVVELQDAYEQAEPFT